MIATNLRCETAKASHLCIHSAATVLSRDSNEDGISLGGTYKNGAREFWFFGRVNQIPGDMYLLSLFVNFRQAGTITIFIPNIPNILIKKIVLKNAETYCLLRGPTQDYRYQSSEENDSVFIRTFCFTRDDLRKLGTFPLLVPFSIKEYDFPKINLDFVKNIKLEYSIKTSEAMYERRETEGAFVIQTATHKEYPMHLSVAAAHSPVFMDISKENKNTYFLNMDDEYAELLIGFLYTGTADNMRPDQVTKVLELANMLKLPGFSKLAEIIMTMSLTEDNAVDTAIQAKQNNLPQISDIVFHFMKHNPAILISDSIKYLNDIDLIRSMLQGIVKPCDCHEDDNDFTCQVLDCPY